MTMAHKFEKTIDTREELIEKLKVSPHINNITYPFVCRCDMDREERFNTDNLNKEFTRRLKGCVCNER